MSMRKPADRLQVEKSWRMSLAMAQAATTAIGTRSVQAKFA